MTDTSRILQLKRLRETRQRLSQQRMNAALSAEAEHTLAAQTMRSAYVAKQAAAKHYVFDRFRAADLSNSPTALFTSLSLGHHRMRREVSHLRLEALNQIGLRDRAKVTRVQVAKDHLATLQKTKLFCDFADETIRKAQELDDDRTDDAMAELHSGRTRDE